MKDFHEFDARLEKNFGIFSPAELSKIAKTRVLIVGLGGIGGYLANALARLGVRQLTLVDFDKFKVTNLNRQLFSSLKIQFPMVLNMEDGLHWTPMKICWEIVIGKDMGKN